MPVVRVPPLLRSLVDGHFEVAVDATTVRAALGALVAAHPGLGDRLLDAHGDLQRWCNVFVDVVDVRTRDGLDTRLGPEDVVTIVPAVAGG